MVENVKDIDNLVDIWITYSKCLAFNRTYILISKKKKISLYNIILYIFIYITATPINFIIILFKLITLKKSIYENMFDIMFEEWYKTIGKKIEVFNGIYYLNARPKKILGVLGEIYPQASENELKDKLLELSQNYNVYKGTQETILLKFKLGKNMLIFHKGFIEKNVTIHATSCLPKHLSSNQKATTPFSELVLKTSTKPAIIITEHEDISKVTFLKKDNPSYVMVEKIWLLKAVYPHLFKNSPLGDSEETYINPKINYIKENLKDSNKIDNEKLLEIGYHLVDIGINPNDIFDLFK